MLPYYPIDEKDKAGHEYNVLTYWEKSVAEYCGISLYEVDEMDYTDYLMIRRDAFIYRMSRTEKGQKYLDNAYRLEQTKPDRKSLRNRFGKEG